MRTTIQAVATPAIAGVMSIGAASAAEIDPPSAFDVAEDHTRFVFHKNGPSHDDGRPDYGNGFVTQGYIYPEGTLDGADGVKESGAPQFPDKVIGGWTCYG